MSRENTITVYLINGTPNHPVVSRPLVFTNVDQATISDEGTLTIKQEPFKDDIEVIPHSNIIQIRCEGDYF